MILSTITTQAVFFASLSNSLAMPISPDVINALDNGIRDDLLGFSQSLFSGVVWSAIVVVIGVVLEGPEILHELWPRTFTFFATGSVRRIRLAKRVLKLIGFAGWGLVVIGVAGEGIFEMLQNRAEGQLQTFNDILLTDAIRQSGDANERAAEANRLAGELGVKVGELPTFVAQKESELNGDITQFQKYARSVQGQTSSDLKRLKEDTDALNKARDDATAAAKQAEAERSAIEARLLQIKTPRSLGHREALISALQPFSGTEYTLNVFMDDESIQFTKSVAAALDAAGWVRKQSAGISLGIPTIQITFADGKTENVPMCVDTGISLHVHSKETLETLQATPVASLPKTVQAALALKSSIADSISPPDERNTMNGIMDPKQEDGVPLTVCVGKKP